MENAISLSTIALLVIGSYLPSTRAIVDYTDSSNRTSLLNPEDLQHVIDEIQKFWTTEATVANTGTTEEALQRSVRVIAFLFLVASLQNQPWSQDDEHKLLGHFAKHEFV